MVILTSYAMSIECNFLMCSLYYSLVDVIHHCFEEKHQWCISFYLSTFYMTHDICFLCILATNIQSNITAFLEWQDINLASLLCLGCRLFPQPQPVSQYRNKYVSVNKDQLWDITINAHRDQCKVFVILDWS